MRGLLLFVGTVVVASAPIGPTISQSLDSGRKIGAPIAILRGAIWADKNNDGFVDGYVYDGQYYAGVPARYQEPSSADPPKLPRSYIGVSLEQLDEPIAAALNIDPYAGEIVRTVVPGSPADHAGLLPGDVILSVGGDAVSQDRFVAQLLMGRPAEVPLKLEILRHGNRITQVISPVARPPESVLAASAGGTAISAGWHSVVADPNTVAHLYGHLSFPDESLSYSLPSPTPGQPVTIYLISCGVPDFKFGRTQASYLNQSIGNAYVSKLTLSSPKAKNWFRLRASNNGDVGQPFLIWLAKGSVDLSTDKLRKIQPVCTTRSELSDAEIHRRFGQLADAAGHSVVRPDGNVADYKWLVRGRSLYQTTRPYGSKETFSNSWVYSYDEGEQRLWNQSAYDAPDDWALFTNTRLRDGSKIVAFQADRQRSEGSSGGGFGGFLKGAIAGAAGMAMGASPETATESAIAGAVAGGFLGAKGEDAGMIGSAAAQGSAQGTAEFERSNSELRRISEQGLSNANSGGRHDEVSNESGPARTSDPAPPSGTTMMKSARAHYSLNLRLTDQSTRNPVCYSRDFMLEFPSTGDRSKDYKTIYALMEAKAGRFQELCTRTRQAALDPPSWAVEGYDSFGEPQPHLEPGNDIVVDAP